MPEKIRFAVVGCGRIAQRHAEHINNLGVVVAVCDVEKGKADALAEKYNAKAFYNLEEMLSYKEGLIDVVAICSPNGLHAQHSISALKAKYNVLCEKPMAISVADCGEMIKTAESENKRLFAIKQNRFNPPVAAVKRIINE
eukprot:gene23377-43880_t